jgi:subtilisin family serine protease
MTDDATGQGAEFRPGGRHGAAGRQRDKLRRQRDDRRQRRNLLEKIQLRRARATAATPFVITDTATGEVLRVPTEVLVRAADVAPGTDGAAVVRDAEFGTDPVECLDGRVVRVSQEGASPAQVRKLKEDLGRAGVAASFAYVTPNQVIMKADATPERAQEAPPSRPSASPAAADQAPVKVAILDTGISRRGRDQDGSDGWLAGLTVTEETRDPLDVFPENGLLDFSAGHGTFVAGLYEQVDPGLDVHIHRVLDSDGIVSEVDVACALVACVRELTDGDRLLVNLSLGTETEDREPPLALSVALDMVREIAAAKDAEVLLVAAAGNDGPGSEPCWPAAFAGDGASDVVAVAALDDAGEPAEWSTRGDWVTCSAVGEAVMSTFVEGREDPDLDPAPEAFGKNAWAYWTGTSFAAPKVAARIAHRAQTHGGSLAAALAHVLSTHARQRQGAEGYGTLLDF